MMSIRAKAGPLPGPSGEGALPNGRRARRGSQHSSDPKRVHKLAGPSQHQDPLTKPPGWALGGGTPPPTFGRCLLLWCTHQMGARAAILWPGQRAKTCHKKGDSLLHDSL